MFENAEQAAVLVEQIQGITFNNKTVQINYFVAKSVRVIISNAR